MPDLPPILIVDDEKLARWSLREALAEQQVRDVDEADSVEVALSRARERTYHLILLDIGLPGLSGIEGLRRLKAEGCTAGVIMVTAQDDPESIDRCLALGAADYICKPFSMDAITSLVLRYLRPEASANVVPGATDAPQWAAYIGRSAAVRALRDQVQRLCRSDAQTILIQGPSGSGKSFLARAIHAGGSRATGPYMELNCAALPGNLLESELFGHEKGAFTDAKSSKPGLFELAHGGVLLLDEIGDMDIALQAKLLRAIEDRRFKRVGGVSDICVDACIIATTNIDLQAAVRDGRFRLDLYYRLHVVPLHIPPLHERPDDIPLLVDGLLQRLSRELRCPVRSVSRGAMSLLSRYPWPGNIRELRNVLERILLLNHEPTIVVDHLPPEIRDRPSGTHGVPGAALPLADPVAALLASGQRLDDIEREVIRQALVLAAGSLTTAGNALGLHRDTLRYRARKFGIID